ncbi:MAG: IPT/TIG domain-containing protein [Mycobacteriales bacterium]
MNPSVPWSAAPRWNRRVALLAGVLVAGVGLLPGSAAAQPGGGVPARPILRGLAQGITSPVPNPSGNIAPNPDFSQVCWDNGGAAASCTSAVVSAIDNARAAEHVVPLRLPANFATLTVADQLFVVTDLERVDRGLPPFAGLTSALNTDAAQAAAALTDPALPSFTLSGGDAATAYASNWAEDYGALAADYDWMYEDGWGGSAQNTFNLACTGPGAPGCWGHRDNILAGLNDPLLLAGMGSVSGLASGHFLSVTELLVGASGPTPSFDYSWAEARAAGADATAPLAVVKPPTVSALSTTSDFASGGAPLTVTGTGFTPGATTVTFTPAGGAAERASSVVVSSTQLVATIPPLPVGVAATVRVSTPAGTAVATQQVTAVATSVASASSPGQWQPLAPYRVTDTRPGVAEPGSGRAVQPGQSLDVLVAGTVPPGGAAGVPADAATVTLNITAVTPAGGGYLTVYPTGSDRPTGSTVNFSPGRTVANFVDVPVGAGGAVSVFNGSGAPENVVVDVEGFSVAGSSGGGFTALAPARVADTRPGSGVAGAGNPVTPSQPLVIDLAGVGSVPVGATAVLLNLVSVDPAGPGYLVAYPDGTAQPDASDVNAVPGQTVAGTVLVPLGSDGAVRIGAGGAAENVVVTALGWLGAGAGGGTLVGSAPTRIADTRAGTGQPDSGAPLVPGSDVSLAVVRPGSPVPATATAVVLNVTAILPSGAGYLELYPDGMPRPVGSDLNYLPGQTSAVTVVVPVGPDGSIRLYSPASTLNVAVDVEGWLS